jgi:hypothetical protein
MDDSYVKDVASQEKPPKYLYYFGFWILLTALAVHNVLGWHSGVVRLDWWDWMNPASHFTVMFWYLNRHLRQPSASERLLFNQPYTGISPKQQLIVCLLSTVVGLLLAGVAMATDQFYLWFWIPPFTVFTCWRGMGVLANHAHSPDNRWLRSHLTDMAACFGSGMTASYLVLGLLLWTQGVNVQSDQYDGPWVFSGLGAPTQNMWLDTDEYTETHGLKVKQRAVPKWPEGLDDEAFDEPCTFRFFIDDFGHTVDARPEDCDERLHEAVREALLQWRWGGKARNWEKQQTWRRWRFKVRPAQGDSVIIVRPDQFFGPGAQRTE